MLIIDDREPVSDLTRLLASFDLQTTSARLDFGDFCWEGSGPSGPMMVGVERKRMEDLVNSMQDRRLSGHQLRGMKSTYSYCYLLIEDMYRPSRSGPVERWSNGSFQPVYARREGVLYQQLDSYLCSLTLRAGVEVVRSANLQETAAILASRYKNWQKPWDSHHSHDAIYAPGPDIVSSRKALGVVRSPGPVELVASQLPGIDRKAWLCGEKWDRVVDMVNAGLDDWMSIEGVGKVTARKIVKWLRGNK